MNELKKIIKAGKLTVDDYNSYTDKALKALLEPHQDGVSTIKAIYITKTGAGDKTGTSWENAYPATELKNAIDDITDAEPDKVYFVLVASGVYPIDLAKGGVGTLSMKNNVIITGGWQSDGGWTQDGFTEFNGGWSGEGQTDGTQVFYNNNLASTAALYGVIIRDGYTTGDGGGMQNSWSWPTLVNVGFYRNKSTQNGGGMNNDCSNPILVNVIFSVNSAKYGGGMYNSFDSSPTLEDVNFYSNRADDGGGMHNFFSSSPRLVNAGFFHNSAEYGGGMYNSLDSSPTLENVIFIDNKARSYGGGMFNYDSSPTLVNAEFTGNKAAHEGGGMYNRMSSSPSLENVRFNKNTPDDEIKVGKNKQGV